jgi:hypothetical protein
MEGTYPIDLGVEVDNGFSTRPAIVCTYRARPDPVVRASGASGPVQRQSARLTKFTKEVMFWVAVGVIQVRFWTWLKTPRIYSMPWITASLSCVSRRYGAVMTRVLKLGVMPIRPREVVPVPRYWVMVMLAILVSVLTTDDE